MKRISPKVFKAAITRVIKKIQSGWTKGAMARNKHGNGVSYDSPEACRWCAVGAINSSIKDETIRFQVFERVNKEAGGLMLFNDCLAKKKSQVISVFQSVYDQL